MRANKYELNAEAHTRTESNWCGINHFDAENERKFIHWLNANHLKIRSKKYQLISSYFVYAWTTIASTNDEKYTFLFTHKCDNNNRDRERKGLSCLLNIMMKKKCVGGVVLLQWAFPFSFQFQSHMFCTHIRSSMVFVMFILSFGNLILSLREFKESNRYQEIENENEILTLGS